MSASTARIVSSSRLAPKKSAVVIDLGSAFIKCGFAGEPRPVEIIPSVIGDAGTGMAPGRTREQWIEVLTDVFSSVYAESLQCRPRERRVVLCESMVCPRALREAVAHVLFRFLQVPALHLCAGPAPALYCTGADTGIILDIGKREAHVVCVYRGMTLINSYSAAPLGCRAVQDRVRETLDEEEHSEGGTEGDRRRGRRLSNEELEDVMVRACLVPVGGVPSVDQVSPMELIFSGQRRVTASAALRTNAAEQAMFEGNGEGESLATLVLDSLRRCPGDCRRALAQNVLVIGGGALLPGLCARLGQEIRALVTHSPTTETRHNLETLGKPEGYAWARAIVLGESGLSDSGNTSIGSTAGVDGQGLCVVRPPAGLARHLLLWTGASVMASLGGIAERSLTNEQYLGREGGMGTPGAGLPDWMSVSRSDWLFSAPPAATRTSAVQ